MKYLSLCLLLFGCADTTVYKNGHPIFHSTANSRLIVFEQGDTKLRIEGHDPARVVRAQGSVLGTGLAGAAPIVSLLKGGILP